MSRSSVPDPGGTPARRIVPLLLGLASVVVIVVGLRAIADLLGPVLLSLFIVLASRPLSRWLRDRGVPQWIAFALVLTGVIAVGLALLLFLGVSLSQFARALPAYRELLDERLAGLFEWLSGLGLRGEHLRELEWFQPTQLVETLLSLISASLNTLSWAGFTLLVFVYMLASATGFSERLRAGLRNDPPLLGRIRSFSDRMGDYLAIKSGIGAATALVQTALMMVMGIDFALLWGLFSFLFNFVPNIGFFIALIPPTLMALLTLGMPEAIVFAAGYALVNNFFDMVVAPRYLGRGLDLSVVVTFLAVVFWAWVLGPIGAFLALPLTVGVKTVLLESYPETRLLAELMGSRRPDAPSEVPGGSLG